MKSAGTSLPELFTDSYCNTCNAQLISQSQRVAHYESKKHANKVRLYYMLHPEDGGPPSKKLRSDNPDSDDREVDRTKCCTLCNMFFTSVIVAQSHYQGKTHAKRMRLVLGESPVPAPTAESSPESLPPVTPIFPGLGSVTDNGDSAKFCRLCSAWFNNPMMAQQHYEGKKHKKNAARVKLLQQLGKTLDSEALRALKSSYTCNICNVILNSVEQFHAHLQGSKHQSNGEAKDDGGPEAAGRATGRAENGGETARLAGSNGKPARDKKAWRGALPGCGAPCGSRHGEEAKDAEVPGTKTAGRGPMEGPPNGDCRPRLGREKRSWGAAMRGWGEVQGRWASPVPGCGEPPTATVGGCSYYE
ncbi:zinc finger protein isoform X2 [Leucoraja erinacea]|nr:zinc finger protein isoform X2 [Leucoraja erinacea]